MRNIMSVACLAMLTACSTSAPVSSVATTVVTVDKKTVIAADDLYVRSSKYGKDLVKQGLIPWAQYEAIDDQAYSVLLRIRVGSATINDLTAVTALFAEATKR